MIDEISLRDLTNQVELIPQAIVNERVETVARRLKVDLVHGQDDLDQYEGFGIIVDGALKSALMHYRGHPDNTFTIYLPFSLRDVLKISEAITRIIRELDIPESSIRWQRKDNPRL